jgi:competence protein ComEC
MQAWIAAEAGRFALWLPVGMAAGVVGYFSLSAEPAWWLGASVLAVLGVVAWLLRGHQARALCGMAAAMAIGFTSGQFATWRAAPPGLIPTHATIAVGVVGAVEQLPQSRRVTLLRPVLDGAAPLERAVRIKLRADDLVTVRSGDTLRVRAMVMRPAPPAYPGAWDLQRDAFFAGFGGYGYALGQAAVVARAPPGGLAGWLQAPRERIAGRMATALAGSQAAIATTLLTGSASGIPDADRAAFRDSGLAHLLAIAGLHVGIVMGLAFGASRLLLALWEPAALRLPGKPIAAVTALLAGGAYMLLTGAHVPIVRSFSMACLVTLGVLAGRRAVSLRGLAVAMAVLILLAPNEVLGVSFQMSFAAVLALIAGYAALRPALARLRGAGGFRRWLLSHIVALSLTSALAGTASAPYGAYHFGHIQVYYVLANLVAVPLVALWVMPAGLAALALMPLHLEAVALVPMGWGIAVVLAIGRAISALPDAVLAVPHMPVWGLAILSLGIAWLGLWRTRLRLLGGAAIVLGLSSPLVWRAPDVLISADARLLAIRGDGGFFIQKQSGASRFTQDAWAQLLAGHSLDPLPAEGPAADHAITCTPVGCVLGRDGQRAVLMRAGAAPDCAATLLISAEPIRGPCATGVIRLDRFSVWRDGAHAVWLTAGGLVVLSDRQFRGDRPWVAPTPPPASPRGALRAALSE